MSSSGSNSVRPHSPKWPTQLCSLHTLDCYGSPGPFLTTAAEMESEVQEPLLCATTAAGVSQYRGDLWMGFLDLNRCRRTAKYWRLVRPSCRWKVGKKKVCYLRKPLSKAREEQAKDIKTIYTFYKDGPKERQLFLMSAHSVQ